MIGILAKSPSTSINKVSDMPPTVSRVMVKALRQGQILPPEVIGIYEYSALSCWVQ